MQSTAHSSTDGTAHAPGANKSNRSQPLAAERHQGGAQIKTAPHELSRTSCCRLSCSLDEHGRGHDGRRYDEASESRRAFVVQKHPGAAGCRWQVTPRPAQKSQDGDVSMIVGQNGHGHQVNAHEDTRLDAGCITHGILAENRRNEPRRRHLGGTRIARA